MAFPAAANFTSSQPGSAWWIDADRFYQANAASFLARVRGVLGLRNGASDLKWDPELLSALRGLARARAEDGWPFYREIVAWDLLPADRVTRATLAVAAHAAGGNAVPISALFLSDAVVVPRLGDVARGPISTLAAEPWTESRAAQLRTTASTSNIFHEESVPTSASTPQSVSSPIAVEATRRGVSISVPPGATTGAGTGAGTGGAARAPFPWRTAALVGGAAMVGAVAWRALRRPRRSRR